MSSAKKEIFTIVLAITIFVLASIQVYKKPIELQERLDKADERIDQLLIQHAHLVNQHNKLLGLSSIKEIKHKEAR